MNSENKKTVRENTGSSWSFWNTVTSAPTERRTSTNPRPANLIPRVTAILIAGLTISSCGIFDWFDEQIPDAYINVLEVAEDSGTVDALLLIVWRDNPAGPGGRHLVSSVLSSYPEIIVIWTSSPTLTDPSGSAMFRFQGSSLRWDIYRADMMANRIPVHN